ncbi:hypothetical protein KSX_53370 [Ktedonospora formicarum]|uniref:Uncharacterized protein n=1 Tax=Ktedonospora formicarum TaxID=2778364 RepID=A0A8J3I0P8_9CHLR|nr:hypothetical protein KSX_53370 [Ktedonospora formicarum]
MGESRGWRSAVPMFFPWFKPNHVSKANLLDWFPSALDSTETVYDYERLAEGVTVPCGPSTRLECDSCTTYTGRIRCLKWGIDADRSSKILGWSFARRM